MDFDEYEYLEKTVEDLPEDKDSSKKKKSDSADIKSERTYRKRDVDDDLDGEDRRSK
ncbi:RNA-binding protein, partial [Trifolium medium]|nr:RNA-binding protein [Trifolium medium]